MSAARRILILVGLLGVAAATFLPLGPLGLIYSGLGAPWGREALWWALTAVMLIYVLVIERRPLSSIGFKTANWGDLALSMLAAGLIVVGMGLIYSMVFPLLHLKPNTTTSAALLGMPFAYRVAIVTRAAFAEEILFRGYGLERIKELTGSKWFAGLVTMAGFTYAHLAGWGAAHLIPVAWAAFVLTVFYLWRRNLWTVIIAHWLTDFVGVVLSPVLH